MALFLNGSEKAQYGGLKSLLAQNMSMVRNQYPRTAEEALNTLNTYSHTTTHKQKGKTCKSEDRRTNMAFAQISMERKSKTQYNMLSLKSICKGIQQKNKEQMLITMRANSKSDINEIEHTFS